MKKWTLDRPEPIWVNSVQKVREVKEKIARTHVVAIDTETDGLDIARSRPRFWSLATDLNSRYFLEDTMLPVFAPVFADPSIDWIGSHTKFDAHMLQNAGYNLAGNLYCTLVMDRLLDPDNDHGLKESYEREFGENMATFAATFFPRSKKTGKPTKPPKKSLIDIMEGVWDTNPKRVIEYASLDAWASLRLFYKLAGQLDEQTTWTGQSLWEIYLEYEMPFTKVLLDCESRGIQIDVPYLQSLEPKIREEMDVVSRQLNKAAGQPINPNSPKQLQELFFGKMGLKPLAWTSGGRSGNKKPSVAVGVLETFAGFGVAEAQMVLRYRKLTKMLGTYVIGIIDRLGPDGRLHGSLNQHVTDTARLSGTEPNLQNLPRPSSDEFKIRQAFIASPGMKFLSADYAQLEMYLMGHFSGDKGMIRNIREGLDIHAGNAALVWGVPYEDIIQARRDKDAGKKLTAGQKQLLEYRQFAKVVGFGLNYGKGAKLLASELRLHEKFGPSVRKRIERERPGSNEEYIEAAIERKARKEAQKIIDVYFERIPGVQKFIDVTHYRAAETKYVESIIGRRRWLRQIMSMDDQLAHEKIAMDNGDRACWCMRCRDSRAGDRRSVNTIIQGSAADVTMMAMLKCHSDPWLSECHMLFQVHDEINFEVPTEIADEAAKRIQHNMEHPGLELCVPLKAEPSIGYNWVEAH